MLRILLETIISVCLVFVSGNSLCVNGQLIFTAIPGQSDEILKARSDDVTAYLEDYIQTSCGSDVTVTYNPVSNYEDAVDALLTGNANFAWYGGLTGVEAGLKSTPSIYIAQRLEDTKFTSVFIHGPDLDLPEGIESANNRSLGFGSNSSTSGHLMPQYYMNKADPPVVPSSITFYGSHDETVNAVANGTVDVGAVNTVTWDSRVAANTTGGAIVFYKTPEFVDYLWVAGATISEIWNTTDASLTPGCESPTDLLTEAFLAATNETALGAALLSSYSTVGYVAIKPGEYDPIEITGCELELIEPEYCKEQPPKDLGQGVGSSEDGTNDPPDNEETVVEDTTTTSSSSSSDDNDSSARTPLSFSMTTGYFVIMISNVVMLGAIL
jgi:phosphonate transport system substrate-binding protein